LDPERENEAKDLWKSFYKRQGQYSFIPKDPYSHQASLLYPHNLNVEEFGDLLNQHLLLGKEEDPIMLQHYQEEIYFITSIFAMCKQDPDLLQDLFNLVYYPFIIGIRMTTILDGAEREMQGFTYRRSGSPRRRSKFPLFGKKKKMNAQDILMPEEEYWDEY